MLNICKTTVTDKQYTDNIDVCTVADKQSQPIWKAPIIEFCSAQHLSEINSECRFGTFERSGVERYEPIYRYLNFCEKWPKILANTEMSFLIHEKMRKKFLS